MQGENAIVMDKELELLFLFVEEKITLEEYKEELEKLQMKREEKLREQGLLKEKGK